MSISTVNNPSNISSPILFHCWRHENESRARYIFENICRTGLLLTTNHATLDTFSIDRGKGKGVEAMEVMQRPRVCFTDIPLPLLATHGDRYGRYGVGFQRQTIVEWGGLPAWYMPNHWDENSLKSVGPALVNGLHAAKDAAAQFKAVVEGLEAKGIPMRVDYKLGGTVSGATLAKQLDDTVNALFMMLSFIKEMSPISDEDYRYLYEREWRLVAGFQLKGYSPPCVPLTPSQKEALCLHRPEWTQKRTSSDANIAARFPDTPVVDSFEYFNGIPGLQTVAQSIHSVLVPTPEEAVWLSDFLSKNAAMFGASLPEIIVFPST